MSNFGLSTRPSGGPWRFGLGIVVFLILATFAGSAQASYRLFDDLEDEILGPIHGQDGWSSSGGDNRVAVDPADPANQVLYVPSESSVLRKSLLDENVGIPDGTVRMVFMRLRVSNKQTFSLGVTGATYPSEFSDFATEIGMANSAENLDLRAWDEDGARYEMLTQLASDTWYNMWVLVDASRNVYQIWLNDVPGARAFGEDKLRAPNGNDTFAFRTGRTSDLFTFFLKTAGGSSGTNFGPIFLDDIHVELTNALNLNNPLGLDGREEVRGLSLEGDAETLTWTSLSWTDTYDVVRGDLSTLRDTGGDYLASVTTCVEDNVEGTSAIDPESPEPGGAFFYVVRGVIGVTENGTFDTLGAGQITSRDSGIEFSPDSCP
jgi:hypothetical protein